MKPPVKLALLTLVSMLVNLGMMAQSNLTLYQMPHVPQAHQLNPANNLYAKGYLIMPLLSGGSIGLGNSAFPLADIGISTPGFNFGDRLSYDALLSQMDGSERFSGGAHMDWLFIGFAQDKGYWSFGMSESVVVDGRYDRGFMELLADADAGRLLSGKTYAMPDLRGQAMHYRSFSVGYSRELRKGLSVGGRFKYLWGYEAFKTENNNLQITGTGEPNRYNVSGQLHLLGSALTNFAEKETDFLAYFFNPENQGFAFDVGMHWRVNDQWEVSASLVDVGRIQWGNATNSVAVNDTIADPFDQIESFFDFFTEEENPQRNSFTTTLPARAYLNVAYYFKPQTSVGLLVHPRFWGDEMTVATSVSINTRIRKWLGLTANYAYQPFNPVNVGTGFSVNLGALQIYGATDNILGFLSDQQLVHLQGGLNYTFKRTIREPYLHTPMVRQDDLFQMAPPTDDVEAVATLPTAPDPQEQSPYYTLNGDLRSREDGAPVDQYNMDVFEVLPDGSEDLVRTGRYPRSTFQLTLRRGVAYVLRIERWQYETAAFQIPADFDREDEVLLLFIEKQQLPGLPFAVEGKTSTIIAPPVEETVPEEEIIAEAPSNNTDVWTSRGGDAAPEILTLKKRTSLRAADTHKSTVLQRLDEGAEVELLEKTRASWWKVRYGDAVGWVKSALLEQISHRS
jgi:hypothetical protein